MLAKERDFSVRIHSCQSLSPKRLPASALSANILLSSKPCSTLKTPAQTRRILVSDDDLDVAQSIVILLRDMGHSVQFAINGYAALDVARRFLPEIVFLDIGLPDMDGWLLAAELRRQTGLQDIRIVVVTGRAGEEDRRRSMQAGCEEHLVKPLDLKFVEALVEARS